MGPQFISSIRPHLEGVWTQEHEDAWENLFKLMCYYMKKGMCSIWLFDEHASGEIVPNLLFSSLSFPYN